MRFGNALLFVGLMTAMAGLGGCGSDNSPPADKLEAQKADAKKMAEEELKKSGAKAPGSGNAAMPAPPAPPKAP